MASRTLEAAAGWEKYPPRTPMPALSLHSSTSSEETNVNQIVDKWTANFATALERRDSSTFESLFVQESWWRDLVALTWNVGSKYGPKAIRAYVFDSSSGLRSIKVIRKLSLKPRLEKIMARTFIQIAFTFVTTFGSGRGVVRLANIEPGEWKAWTVSTELERLKKPRHSLGNFNYESKANDLQVLVVGGGQCGVSLAAHLEQTGLRYLLVEKTPNMGDSWRNRYSTLKTHTPSAMDNLPFLRFPTTWPTNMTKDQYADWIECYCTIMKLNIHTSTCVVSVVRNQEKRNGYSYTVLLEDPSGNRYTITAKHVVLSTGLHSDEPNQLGVPGQNTFRGEMYHSSRHKSAANVSNLANKSVTIVGTGTSAHDIAQDFVNHGAKSVTMIQRGPNIFVSLESLETFMLALWMTPDLATEDADLIETSFPNVVALTLESDTMHACAEFDKELIDGMEKAGMVIRKGEDGIGLLDHLLLKSGHFYIDHGAARMICDGRIKIRVSQKGVGAVYERGLTLADGTKVESDVIVTATGFDQSNNIVERLLGKELADAVGAKEWGGLDDESERIGWWRPSGVPGIWCMSGGISWARQYSRVLALQIDAVEKGYNSQYDNTAPRFKL